MGPRAVQGQVQQQMSEAAEAVGLSRRTLSSYLVSYDFVRGIGADYPDQARILRRSPPLVVDAYRRWASTDLQGALAHILLYEKQDLAYASVLAAEKAARRDVSLPDEPFSQMIVAAAAYVRMSEGRGAARQRLGGVAHTLTHLHNRDWISWTDEASAAWLGVTRISAPPADTGVEGLSVAIIESKSYAAVENYRAYARQIALQATVASHRFDMVIVVMPDAAAWFETVTSIAVARSDAEDARATSQDLKDLGIRLARGENWDVATAISMPSLTGAQSPILICSPETFVSTVFEAGDPMPSLERAFPLRQKRFRRPR